MKQINTQLKFLFYSLLVSLAFLAPQNGSAADCAVVVNASNSYSAEESSMKKQAKRLFLKELMQWPAGMASKIYVRENSTTIHNDFLQDVLNKTSAEYASHWLSVKQKTGETPPREVKSIKILLRLVGKKEGAIGVVSKNEAQELPENVKVLFQCS